MDKIDKELEMANIDWKEIKRLLCHIGQLLQDVCNMLPGGIIKNIICGVAGVVNLICHQLPGLKGD